ncbi:MAG TPA: alpha/beta fold hydrolase [Trebonia sp.]|nr:alpha/beta fold hydrolase [Trebonia sp.]
MELAYEQHGTGPALVLLHGVGHRRQAWQPVLDLLTPHRTVIMVDLPGHGDSPPLRTEGRAAIRAIADEIVAFFDALGLDRPHVAGNSLGGALALAAGARGRAATVTTLSPAGFWANPWQYGYARAAFRFAQRAGAVGRPQILALARIPLTCGLTQAAFVARPSNITPEHATADALAFLRARDAVYAILADREIFTDTVPASVPVTIGWGTRDRMLPPSQARVAMRRLPHARFVPLPGCGHVPMTDDPVLVASVLLDGSGR